jgi:arabinogalactan endo-1,4-beta-galactosidase
MKAAEQGIQDACGAVGATMPKIIVHIDRGADWATTEWYFDNLNAQGVPYDIIGESYYLFFHGALTNVTICLSNAAVRYGKPLVVAETAFPWTNSMTSWTNKLYGFAPTPDGQVSFIAALAKVVKSVPNHLGAGIFYWGAEYQTVSGVNEAGFNTSALFDNHGNLLPAADGLAGTAAPLVLTPSISGANLQLTWPFSGAAARLEISSNGGAIWWPVTNTVSISGTKLVVTLPLTEGSAFYRLRSP